MTGGSTNKITSPLCLAVGPQSPIRRMILKTLNACHFDYTVVVFSGKVERS